MKGETEQNGEFDEERPVIDRRDYVKSVIAAPVGYLPSVRDIDLDLSELIKTKLDAIESKIEEFIDSLPFQDSPEEKLQERAQDEIDGLFREVEDGAVENLTEFCDLHSNLSVPDPESPEELRSYIRQSEDLLVRVTDDLDTSIDTSEIEEILRKLDEIGKVGEVLLPTVQSIDDVIDSSCTLHELRQSDAPPEKRERAQIDLVAASAGLIVQLLSIKYQVGYRVSFALTRSIANRYLVRIREFAGLTGYTMLLREIHWILRESVVTTTASVVDFAVETTAELMNELGDDFWKVFEEGDYETIESATSIVELTDSEDDDDWF